MPDMLLLVCVTESPPVPPFGGGWSLGVEVVEVHMPTSVYIRGSAHLHYSTTYYRIEQADTVDREQPA